MIKAIIFDLNGIFLQSPKLSERFAKDFKVPVETFVPKLSSIMDAARKPGALAAFSLWQPVLQEWGIEMTEEQFWNYWFTAEIVSERMISFAKELRSKDIGVYTLSNNFKERSEFYGQYPWVHEAVDTVYFSWHTGFVKPDVRAWQLVLDENNLKGEECLYFDDQEKNLIAARSIGIESFIFTNEEELEKIVLSRLN